MAHKVAAKYWLAGLGANLIWGILVIPIKVLQNANYDAQTILLGRVACAILILLFYLLLVKRDYIFSDWHTFKGFSNRQKISFISALCATSLALFGNWIFFLKVIQDFGTKEGVLVYLSNPIITAFLGFVVLKEKKDLFKIISLMLATGVIAYRGKDALDSIIWVFCSAMSFSLYIILQKSLPKISRTTIFTCQLLVILALLIPMYGNSSEHDMPKELFFWADCIVIGSLFTILPVILNLYSLIRLPASSVAILMYVTPLMTFILAVFYFHEPLGFRERIEYLILIIAIILFNGTTIKDALRERKLRKLAKRHAHMHSEHIVSESQTHSIPAHNMQANSEHKSEEQGK